MEIIPLLAFLGVGILAGLIGGLLGLSGGVVTVPALVFIFPAIGIPEEQVTHMAIGTSLAAMVFNGIVSTWSHHRRQGVVWDLFLSLLPWITIGALFGGHRREFHLGCRSRKCVWLFYLLSWYVSIFATKKEKRSCANLINIRSSGAARVSEAWLVFSELAEGCLRFPC